MPTQIHLQCTYSDLVQFVHAYLSYSISTRAGNWGWSHSGSSLYRILHTRLQSWTRTGQAKPGAYWVAGHCLVRHKRVHLFSWQRELCFIPEVILCPSLCSVWYVTIKILQLVWFYVNLLALKIWQKLNKLPMCIFKDCISIFI